MGIEARLCDVRLLNVEKVLHQTVTCCKSSENLPDVIHFTRHRNLLDSYPFNGQTEPAAYEGNAAAALGRWTARFIISSAKGSRLVVSSWPGRTAGSKDASRFVCGYRSWELHAPDAQPSWAPGNRKLFRKRVELQQRLRRQRSSGGAARGQRLRCGRGGSTSPA